MDRVQKLAQAVQVADLLAARVDDLLEAPPMVAAGAMPLAVVAERVRMLRRARDAYASVRE